MLNLVSSGPARAEKSVCELILRPSPLPCNRIRISAMFGLFAERYLNKYNDLNLSPSFFCRPRISGALQDAAFGRRAHQAQRPAEEEGLRPADAPAQGEEWRQRRAISERDRSLQGRRSRSDRIRHGRGGRRHASVRQAPKGAASRSLGGGQWQRRRGRWRRQRRRRQQALSPAAPVGNPLAESARCVAEMHFPFSSQHHSSAEFSR